MDPTTDIRVTVPPLGAGMTVAVHGELDIATAPVLRERLLDVLHHHGPRLVVDLADVSFCDATGLAALVATERRARLLGGTLRLANPQDRVAKVLRVTHLDRHFKVYGSTVAATRHLDLASPGSGGRRCMQAPVQQRRVHGPNTRAEEDVHAVDVRRAVGAVLAHTGSSPHPVCPVAESAARLRRLLDGGRRTTLR